MAYKNSELASSLDRPTPVERFVRIIPLRYPLALLIWTIVLGPLSFSIVQYAQSGTLFYFPAPLNAALGSVLFFYGFYSSRYVRLKVLAAESSVSPIVSGGDTRYRSLFGRVTSTRSIAILAVVLEVIAFLSTLQGRVVSINTALDLITQVLIITTFSTLLWEYAAASWGLHMLGESQLRLKSFLEDRFMGARPVGNLSLSLTIAYLGGLLFFFLDTLTFLDLRTTLALFSFFAFYIILLALGIIMFFLPLNSLHKRMQTEKSAHQKEQGLKLSRLLCSNASTSNDGLATIERVQTGITELVQMKDFEITERKLASTPTWPFDIQLLARLITIVLSITAVLLSRIITDYLHI